MDQKHFEDLLERYLRGECTEDEIRRVKQWFDQIEDSGEENPTKFQRAVISQRVFKRIDHRTRNRTNRFDLRHYKYWVSYGAAALILIGLTWVLYFSKKTDENATSSNNSYSEIGNIRLRRNTSSINQLIILEDKSSVLLAPGSEVSYRTHFEKTKREVRLKGNAFFEVTKNQKRPFVVYCGGTVTEVIGTSFWIKTLTNSKAIEIAVKTGKVSVSQEVDVNDDATKIHTERVLLTPNQRVVFFAKKKQVETLLVETPLLLDSLQARPDRFLYNDAPLAQVLFDLTEGYGIEIQTSNDRLKTCSFTGDLSEMNFEEKFEIVCESIGTQYMRQGTKILLTGEGCK
jgi:transmembrane sensor